MVANAPAIIVVPLYMLLDCDMTLKEVSEKKVLRGLADTLSRSAARKPQT